MSPSWDVDLPLAPTNPSIPFTHEQCTLISSFHLHFHFTSSHSDPRFKAEKKETPAAEELGDMRTASYYYLGFWKPFHPGGFKIVRFILAVSTVREAVMPNQLLRAAEHWCCGLE